MRITAPCEHGGGFLRSSCGRAAIAECVYCGKPFCDQHGALGEDFTHVCDRKACLAKVADLEVHQAWKRVAYESNRMSVCAHDECTERMHHVCSRCRLLFCAAHVREQYVTIATAYSSRKELANICFHCRARRELWD